MSQVVSMRLKENQMERLRRVARRMGRSPSEASALLVEEGLRKAEFAYIEFRDSPVGRQACIQGSSLAVWEVVMVAQEYELDAKLTAEHLRWPVFKVQAALNYAAAFPDEIETAIADNDSYDFDALSRVLPQVERITVPEDDDIKAQTRPARANTAPSREAR